MSDVLALLLAVLSGIGYSDSCDNKRQRRSSEELMYRLFANVEYKNGDFERRVIEDFIEEKEAEASALVNNAAYEGIPK